jgi:hypothetical protein
MFIPDPDFLSIPDLGSWFQQQKRRDKNLLVLPFFVATDIIK